MRERPSISPRLFVETLEDLLQTLDVLAGLLQMVQRRAQLGRMGGPGELAERLLHCFSALRVANSSMNASDESTRSAIGTVLLGIVAS